MYQLGYPNCVAISIMQLLNPGKLGSSILSAMNYYQIARDHKWTFQPRPDVTGIDFDAIYLQQLQMSNLPLSTTKFWI
jgi:hypothetical protein